MSREAVNVYSDLAAVRCRPCGKKKGSGKTLCWNCWCKLPATLKARLYDPENYPATVAEAYVYLEKKGVA